MRAAESTVAHRKQLLILGGLVAYMPLSSDMYVAAFPQLAGDLHASSSQVQLTLTACVAGLALGRVAFSAFAASLAVHDQASLQPAVISGLVAAIVTAIAIGAFGAAWVARRSPPMRFLRAE